MQTGEKQCLRKSGKTSWKSGSIQQMHTESPPHTRPKMTKVNKDKTHTPCPRGIYIPGRETDRNQITHCKCLTDRTPWGSWASLYPLGVKSRGPRFWRVNMVCSGMVRSEQAAPVKVLKWEEAWPQRAAEKLTWPRAENHWGSGMRWIAWRNGRGYLNWALRVDRSSPGRNDKILKDWDFATYA